VYGALNVPFLHHRWAKFISKMQNEWRELGRIVCPTHYATCTIIANAGSQGTVLLTANVAFLAIPSVDSSTNGLAPGTGTGSYIRTPAQVTSFMSVIFSLGCLAIVQLLLRHHMVRPQDSAEEVVSPFPSSYATRSRFRTLVDPFPRTSTYAAITIPIAVWKRWRYCIVFHIPYFSGRKSPILRSGINI
jgi:hypothetical protein